MQFTASPDALTTLRSALAGAAAARPFPAPSDLLFAFSSLPDPRSPRGKRFSLRAMLALSVAALLANHHSILAIAEWGKAQPHTFLEPLGFPAGYTPHQSTLHRLFRRLDPIALATAAARFCARASVPARVAPPPLPSLQGVALDGKAQRGRLAFDHTSSPVHALSAVAHQSGLVLDQLPITVRGDKAEAELTVAPALIARLDWRDRVLTGDALFCQRTLARQVLAAGGDYLFVVKENQPTLYGDLRLLFDPPPGTPPLTDRREARSLDQGHGRHDEVRHLVASTDLVGYCDFPGVAQVWRWERRWREQRSTKQQVRYGITSVGPERADAAQLLALKRGHWIIENGLHYVKDVTFGEDRSLVHLDAGPMVMAILRDLTLNVLRLAGVRHFARWLRLLSSHPECVVALVRGQIPVFQGHNA